MKLNLAVLGSVATLLVTYSTPTCAQYFSEGWKPGQPAPAKDAAQTTGWTPGQKAASPLPTDADGAGVPVATPEAASAASPFENLNLGKLLVSSLNKLGMNLSVPTDSELGLWDPRIPLLTDENYEDMIVNEQFESEEEAAERTWAIVITSAASNKAEAISKYVDGMFDSAYNTTQHLGDLPHVRWARVDYFNVTYLTTKWNVWQSPYLLIIKDRGQSLWFYRPTQIRVKDDLFREFLADKGYARHPPWTGVWAPGGDREWILDIFARYMTKAYNVFVKIPKVLLYLISGGLGSMLLNFMHKPSKEQLRAQEAAERAAKEKKALEERRAKAQKAVGAAGKEVEKAQAVLDSTKLEATQQSPKAKGKSPQKKGSTSAAVESSTEGSVNSTSPAKTRSSARQRKGKKANQ